MNTKLITVLLILLVVWVGYKTYTYYGRVQEENQPTSRRERTRVVVPGDLSGYSTPLHTSLETARRAGAPALKRWIETYGAQVPEPHKSAIELDYCTIVARDNPQEARAVFAAVKARVQPSSPVYARVKELEKSLE